MRLPCRSSSSGPPYGRQRGGTGPLSPSGPPRLASCPASSSLRRLLRPSRPVIRFPQAWSSRLAYSPACHLCIACHVGQRVLRGIGGLDLGAQFFEHLGH